MQPNNGTKRGRGGGTRRSGEREEKKKRKEKKGGGEKKKKKKKTRKQMKETRRAWTNKTAKPSGAGTQRPWPTAGCDPLLLPSA